MQMQEHSTAQLSMPGTMQGQLSYVRCVVGTQARKPASQTKEEQQKERALYYLLPTLGRTVQPQLDAKVGILKTPNTMCWFVEPLESTDKLQHFLPGCKLIRPQEHMLFQQGCVGPKKLLTKLTGDRDKKNRTVVIDLGLIVSSLLH